jgi:glycosyltransferase involved in cell wall biosynthesis
MNQIIGHPKIIVCQHGSRHRYAIPRILENVDMLAALYTDSSANSFLGKCSNLMGNLSSSQMQRLTKRICTGVPKGKIFSSDCCLPIEFKQRILCSQKTGMLLFYQRHQILSNKMKKWGLQNANIIYSMYHENLNFIRWAKNRGLKSVVDVFISPVTSQVMEQEYKIFPDWNRKQDVEAITLEEKLWEETAELADLLICPSEWVAAGIRKVTPQATEKIKIVPYGCSINYQDRINVPIKGRVLFVGEDALRKGLHYLAKAATQLKAVLPEVEVRIAGTLPVKVTGHPVCQDLTFLGKLNSEQIKNEYLTADIFVLPSLSEGFAGVVAEAIGAGCPVIVTNEAGSPIIHEREGLIIPSKDVNALVSAIEKVITNRKLRSTLSKNCIEQVPFYSEKEWSRRLVTAISG